MKASSTQFLNAGIDAWIFDLDNTVVECLRYYEEARERVRTMVREDGLPIDAPAFVERLGVVRKPFFQSMGFGHVSFAAALRETYRSLVEEHGRRARPERLQQAWDAGEGVFHAPYTPYPGAIETLQWLRARRGRIALLTKGEVDAQWRKIRLHALEPYFDHIDIVRYKTVREVRAVLDALGTRPERTVMVGDSLFDDVRSGTQAGCRTIWVNGDPIHHPELHGEEPAPVPDLVIERLADLRTLLARGAPSRAGAVS